MGEFYHGVAYGKIQDPNDNFVTEIDIQKRLNLACESDQTLIALPIPSLVQGVGNATTNSYSLGYLDASHVTT
jgi:hypothetical protein